MRQETADPVQIGEVLRVSQHMGVDVLYLFLVILVVMVVLPLVLKYLTRNSNLPDD